MRWDIREYKRTLRQKYKEVRSQMLPSEREYADNEIFLRLTALRSFQQAELLLCYVSTPIEVSTRRLITFSLTQGKRVAVPRCIPGTVNMEFYQMNSLEELSPGTFGVLEPHADLEKKITDFSLNCLCVIPGLCFDLAGYRLGYGKGYYDRFLSAYNGERVGICYENCIRSSLFHGRFDVAVDCLITEKGLKRLRKGVPFPSP